MNFPPDQEERLRPSLEKVVTLEADEASRLASLIGALDLIIANYPNSWGDREMLQKVSGCLAVQGTIRVNPPLPVPPAAPVVYSTGGGEKDSRL